METKIIVKQLPVISEQLEKAGINVRKRIYELELDKQIATKESVKEIKKLRAELNKESAEFETQLKEVTSVIENPLAQLKEKFKTEIKNPYKEADDLLKDQIAIVENKIKLEKKNNVIAYFEELCLSEKIDFVTFENLGIEINLSTTEKKYKEQVNDYVTKVVDDLALIKTTDFEAEILTEYKKTLNASKSITTVKERKKTEAKEAARIKAELIQNRKNYLVKLGLNYVEITNQYEFNDNIFVSLSDINSMSKEDFTAKYAEIEAKVKGEKLKSVEVLDTIKSNIESVEKDIDTISGATRQKSNSNPVSAPIVEKQVEEIKTASFEVKATLTKLRALGVYMKENGIEYKNI